MIEKLDDKELERISFMHDPVALMETLIPSNLKAPHTWGIDDQGITVRPYQFSMLDYSYMYADDPELDKKHNWKKKIGAGTCYNISARNVGKSWLDQCNDFFTLIHNEGDESCHSSFDFKHLKKVLTPVANLAKYHPFFEMFRRSGKDGSVRWTGGGLEVDTMLGHVLYGKNEKVDSDEPGTDYHGLHVKKMTIEEFSYASDLGKEKRIDAISDLGCIERFSGIPDVRKGSPLGDLLLDDTKKNRICRLPQMVMETWDEDSKQRAIKEYGGENCFDEHTEVLTDSGWKKWYQISKNDKVLSLNPVTNVADYFPIQNVFIYDFDGELNYFDNEYINFGITDNHNLLISTLKKPDLHLLSLKTILDKKPIRREPPQGIFENCQQCGKKLSKIKKQKKFCSRSCQMKYLTWVYYPVNKFFIPSSFKWKKPNLKTKIKFFQKINESSYSFEINDWLEFLGWYVAEGWVAHNPRYKKNGEKYFSNEIFISQSNEANPEKVQEISNLFNKLKINNNYNKKAGRFVFNSSLISEYLEKECGIGAYNKKVPNFIKQLSKKQIEIFLTAFNKGDGDSKRYKYYTSSSQLANDLQELIYKVGKESNIIAHSTRMYLITERDTINHYIYTDNIEKKQYRGKIWCVAVEPYHTIFIRRFNKCMWSGNSFQFKLNILAETIEGAFGRWDMRRVRKLCYNLKKKIKEFEFGRDNIAHLDSCSTFDEKTEKIYELLNKTIVIDNVPSELTIVASDIGTTGTPSQVCIFFGNKDKMKWRYLISLFRLTTQEQARVFNWIYKKLENVVISLDCTDADGRAIADELEILGVPKDRITRNIMHAKIKVGFSYDKEGNVETEKNGEPIYKMESTIDWACSELDKIFYNGLIEVPHSELFLKEFPAYFATKIGTGFKYGSSTSDHLVQSFQCMSVCRFYNLNTDLLEQKPQDTFVGGF